MATSSAMRNVCKFRDGLPGATRHPFEDVRFEPTDVFPVKVMAARDLSDRRQAP